jgi:hypothetical protein
MKTPREILLEQHRAATLKLDAIRHEIMEAKFRRRNFTATLWQELIFPSRRIWSGLAAVWIALVAFNLAQRESIPAGRVVSAPVQMSAREQQRLMNELFADRLPVMDADRPKTFTPKPRTEISQTFTT